MKFKTIKLKIEGKTVYQFDITQTQLDLAKKLGIKEKDFITELAKVNLKEHEAKKDEV
jgi:hypothetical protein